MTNKSNSPPGPLTLESLTAAIHKHYCELEGKSGAVYDGPDGRAKTEAQGAKFHLCHRQDRMPTRRRLPSGRCHQPLQKSCQRLRVLARHNHRGHRHSRSVVYRRA